MEFGEKVQLLRKESGMSQEKLAEQLNVSRQAISKWEQGIVVPDTENIIQLSKYFQIPIEYLLLNEYEQIEKSITDRQSKKIDELKKRWIRKIVIGILVEIIAISATYIMQWIEMEVYGSCYTNPLYYIKEMPVALIAVVGVVCFMIGLVEGIKEKSKK